MSRMSWWPTTRLGTNVLSLSGADAASFELVGNALYYIGASPNFEVKSSYAVIVEVNDTGIPGSPDASIPFTLTITNVNEAPVADADGPYGATEGTLLSVNAASGVLAGDSDIDAGAILTAVLVSGPAHASAFTLNPDGSFNYTPTGDFTGSDTFIYRTSDGSLLSDPVVVTINVGAVNDDPVAGNDTDGIAEDVDTNPAVGVQSVASGNLLDNDTDGDAEVVQDLDVTAVTGPGALIDTATTLTRTDADGALVIDKETGAYTYTVDNGSAAVQALGIGESLTKTFTYTVTDDGVPLATDTATLTITIAGTNDGPVAVANTDSGDGGHGPPGDRQRTHGRHGRRRRRADGHGGERLRDGRAGCGYLRLAQHGVERRLHLRPDQHESCRAGARRRRDAHRPVHLHDRRTGYGGTSTTTLTITINGNNDDGDARARRRRT